MKYISVHSFIVLMLILSSCIGVDVLDDEIIDKKVEITTTTKSLLINATLQLNAIYYNEYGIEEEAFFSWTTSSSDIATIDTNGKLTAIDGGQVTILANANGVNSDEFSFTVVANLDDVAQVVINANPAPLEAGATLQLMSEVYNVEGTLLTGKTVTWASSNESVATINSTGLVTTIADGTTMIIATSEGINSSPLTILVGNQDRVATLMGTGSYKAKGTATLGPDENGDLILNLSSDFEASVALGTFIYLSNSTSGSSTSANGLDLGEISGNGAQSFNVTEIDASTRLEQYQYIVVLCKPAGITFGFGEFN